MSKLCRLVLASAVSVMVCLGDQTQPQTSQTIASGRCSFVEIEGSKLYYQECGTGNQTVILVHDGVINSDVWNDVWPEFCKHFRVIRYDRRGSRHATQNKAVGKAARPLL
jgi:hypothetical protein